MIVSVHTRCACYVLSSTQLLGCSLALCEHQLEHESLVFFTPTITPIITPIITVQRSTRQRSSFCKSSYCITLYAAFSYVRQPCCKHCAIIVIIKGCMACPDEIGFEYDLPDPELYQCKITPLPWLGEGSQSELKQYGINTMVRVCGEWIVA